MLFLVSEIEEAFQALVFLFELRDFLIFSSEGIEPSLQAGIPLLDADEIEIPDASATPQVDGAAYDLEGRANDIRGKELCS
jgi:hypothetical protein